MSLAKHCPRRHDQICRVTGEHDFRCPETEQAVVAHDTGGRFAKGSSGHKYPPKTLGNWRKMIRHLGIDKEITDRLLVFAGIRPDSTGVFPDIPWSVQSRVLLRLDEKLHGRKYEIEHTGIVQHDVEVAVVRGPDPDIERLTIAEKRTLLELRRKMQRQIAAPEATSGAVDAEFEEEKKP